MIFLFPPVSFFFSISPQEEEKYARSSLGHAESIKLSLSPANCDGILPPCIHRGGLKGTAARGGTDTGARAACRPIKRVDGGRRKGKKKMKVCSAAAE